jgi:hypothetical protein
MPANIVCVLTPGHDGQLVRCERAHSSFRGTVVEESRWLDASAGAERVKLDLD